jgi:large subunit ribosomal protein L1
MGAKNKTTTPKEDTIKIVAAEPMAVEDMDETTDQTAEMTAEGAEASEEAAAKPARPVHRGRSRKYHSVRSQVDKTKTYDAFAAVELVKKLSYSKFAGSVEAHGVVREIGDAANVTFPHATGKSVRVAVVDDELLAQIQAGKTDFDVLVSSPSYMPKLARLAKILGPKGLMPNPKNGTLTEDTDRKKKELESGKISIKTEKKAPLFHTVIGKTSMDTKELVENLQTLTTAFKGKLLKLSIAASMSPGVRVDVE